jgi:hypothetical protein
MSAIFLCFQAARWCRDPATCVVAIAAAIYVVATFAIWLSTRKAANAAMSSAEAMKKSAEAASLTAQAAKSSVELLAELHRPLIGIARLHLRNDRSSRTWIIAVVLRNYGTLPAVKVNASIEFLLDSSPLWTVTELGSAEVAPNADYEAVNLLDWGEKEHQSMQEGSKSLIVKVRITYEAAGGRRFEYAAEAQLKHVTGVFQIVKSETRTL